MKQRNALLGPKLGWKNVPNTPKHAKPDQWGVVKVDGKCKQPLVKYWLPN